MECYSSTIKRRVLNLSNCFLQSWLAVAGGKNQMKLQTHICDLNAMRIALSFKCDTLKLGSRVFFELLIMISLSLRVRVNFFRVELIDPQDDTSFFFCGHIPDTFYMYIHCAYQIISFWADDPSFTPYHASEIPSSFLVSPSPITCGGSTEIDWWLAIQALAYFVWLEYNWPFLGWKVAEVGPWSLGGTVGSLSGISG